MSRGVALIVVALAQLTACDQPALHPAAPASTPVSSGRAVAPYMSLAVFASEVTFKVGARDVPATILTPKDPGPWPAIVMMAGTVETDRNWNRPPPYPQNGSGQLLAEELAKHGMIVIRFDNAGTGKNPGPPVTELSLDTYRDEGLGALQLLRTRADVRQDRVFLVGHGEGALHATSVALAASPAVAGILYLAASGRPAGEVMLTQLETVLRSSLVKLAPPEVAREMKSLRAAFAEFYANRSVDPIKATSVPALQQLLAGLMAPEKSQVIRALMTTDPLAGVTRLTVPVFIGACGKDVQLDPSLDLAPLEKALKDGQHEVTVHVSPDADHVLKHEARPLAELVADVLAAQYAYNAPGRVLDEEQMRAVMKWLELHTR